MPHSRRPQSWPCIRLHARLAPLAPLTATGHVPDCWVSLVVSAENHLSLSARAKLSHPVTRGGNSSAPWNGEGGVILVPSNHNFAVVDWSTVCAIAPWGSVLTHYTLTSKLVLLDALGPGARLSSKLKRRYINLLFYV